MKKRQKQNQDRLDLMLILTLPRLCQQIEGYTKFTNKMAFSLSELKKNLRQAPCKARFNEQVQLVAKAAPTWAKIKMTKIGKMLILQRNVKFSQAMQQVEAFVQENKRVDN